MKAGLLVNGSGNLNIQSSGDGFTVTVTKSNGETSPSMGFDSVVEAPLSGEDMYDGFCAPIVDTLAGGNSGCFLVYGQGMDIFDGNTSNETFLRTAASGIESSQGDTSQVTVSFFDVYNDSVRDLIAICRIPYATGEDLESMDCKIPSISKVAFGSVDNVIELVRSGIGFRSRLETAESPLASRSHTVLVFNNGTDSGSFAVAQLAFQETLKKEDRLGPRLKEAMLISASLDSIKKAIASNGAVDTASPKIALALASFLGNTSILASIDSTNDGASSATVAFASDCRNIRMVDSAAMAQNEERISKLVEENQDLLAQVSSLKIQVAASSSRAATPANGKRNAALTAQKLQSIFQAFELGVEVVGNSVTANGVTHDVQKLASGETISRSNSTEPGAASSDDAAQQNQAPTKAEPSTKKLKKIINDLEDELRDCKSKAKDRKEEINEKTKAVANLTQQLSRAQTSLRHKEHQYDTLVTEKSRALEEQDTALRATHNLHLSAIVADNQEVLQQQHKLLQSVPESLRSFSTTRQGLAQKFKESDAHANAERDHAMKKLSDSQKAEIKNLKLQYEHWLKIRADQIKDFAEQFNFFKAQKTAQITALEQEIVTIYTANEKLEKVLTGVENGEYNVSRGQSSIGRPTTGVILQVDDNYELASRTGRRTALTREEMSTMARTGARGGGSRSGTRTMSRSGSGFIDTGLMTQSMSALPSRIQAGGVVIPKGLRPTNPFINKTPDTSLALRIVLKHREMEIEAAKARNSSLSKTLAKAQSGEAMGVLDPMVHDEIKNMISMSTMSRGDRSSIANQYKKGGDLHKEDAADEQVRSTQEIMESIKGGAEASQGPSSYFSEKPIEGDMRLDEYAMSGANKVVQIEGDGWNGKGGGKRTKDDLADAEAAAQEEIERLRRHISMVEASMENDKLKADQIIRGLQSDETLTYILNLESEQEKLHQQLREISSQLHISKVSNASLARRLDKITKLKKLDFTATATGIM